MLNAVNPNTNISFELPADTEVNQIVQDPNSGEMLEVVAINGNVAEVKVVNVEEDWGQ